MFPHRGNRMVPAGGQNDPSNWRESNFACLSRPHGPWRVFYFVRSNL